MNDHQIEEFLDHIEHRKFFPLGGPENHDVAFCGTNCRYCTEQRLFRSSRFPRISNTEFELGCSVVKKDDPYIGFVLPDPFTHPGFPEYLKVFAHRFPTTRAVVATPGAPFDMDLIDFINEHPSIEVNIALNTFDPGMREIILGKAHALEKVVDIIRRLRKVQIMMTYLGDVKLLLNDVYKLRTLAGTHQRFTVRRLEHSKYNPQDVQDLSRRAVATYGTALDTLRDRVDGWMYVCPDMDLILRHGMSRFSQEETEYPPHYLTRVRKYLEGSPRTRYLFCSAPSSAKYWTRVLATSTNALVVSVENTVLAGSFCVAGFMAVEDVKRVSTLFDGQYDMLMLPLKMVDHLGEDFLCRRPSEIGIPYVMV